MNVYVVTVQGDGTPVGVYATIDAAMHSQPGADWHTGDGTPRWWWRKGYLEIHEAPVRGFDPFAEVQAVRGVDPHETCPTCRGTGAQVYPDTSTWRRGGTAGQLTTRDVCDRCWGSGATTPWLSHRVAEHLGTLVRAWQLAFRAFQTAPTDENSERVRRIARQLHEAQTR